MDSISRARRRLTGRRRALANQVREQLRETVQQLSVLNHAVGSRIGLRDVDLDCLDLVQRRGPIGPTDLARRTGVHPATLTGVLNRLEEAGWITRERPSGSSDRRAVVVSARRERLGEVFGLYAGMLGALDDMLAGFLNRLADAGRAATAELVSGPRA
jgi:DNA-binding MarR family transcriptional regulator